MEKQDYLKVSVFSITKETLEITPDGLSFVAQTKKT